ncbi:MAG: hypothetical protein OJJ54_16685 [Pseudonocardia sp.]|nr:hypothetical protein [Pseudonocardia sp.]
MTAVLALALAACGGPSFTYVTNSADRTYLKVPNDWRQIDPKEIEEQVGVEPAEDSSHGLWLEAYDADATPSVTHVFDSPVGTPAPALLVAVQAVPEESRGQLGLDSLRDFFHPVSSAARQQLMAMGGQSPYTGFTEVSDEVLTPGHGIRGVHTVYSYRINGGDAQVFDLTGYLNDDASKVSIALARCSLECFEKRRQEIESVVSSFTVREAA